MAFSIFFFWRATPITFFPLNFFPFFYPSPPPLHSRLSVLPFFCHSPVVRPFLFSIQLFKPSYCSHYSLLFNIPSYLFSVPSFLILLFFPLLLLFYIRPFYSILCSFILRDSLCLHPLLFNVYLLLAIRYSFPFDSFIPSYYLFFYSLLFNVNSFPGVSILDIYSAYLSSAQGQTAGNWNKKIVLRQSFKKKDMSVVKINLMNIDFFINCVQTSSLKKGNQCPHQVTSFLRF